MGQTTLPHRNSRQDTRSFRLLFKACNGIKTALGLQQTTSVRPITGFTLGLTALLVIGLWHLQTRTQLPLTEQLALWLGAQAENFSSFEYLYSDMPRLLMAIMAGAVLGLVGSMMQQLLQNPLVSPMTLGASSGAWLGLVAASVFFPSLATLYREWWALFGAVLATGLSLLVARRSGLRGLPIVLAGMAVSLLFGALSSALVLLNDQYVRNLFIWGAGDLAQGDWNEVLWLLPRLAPVLLLLIFAHRPLMLMRLGDQGARSRGLSLIPVMITLLLIALWLTASVISSVGLIGFIGLLTPQIARQFSDQSARQEMLASALIGAFLLCLTDIIALRATDFFGQLVPSGAAAALIGAPALIILAMKRKNSEKTPSEAIRHDSTFSDHAQQPWLLRSPKKGRSIIALIAVAILSLAFFVFPKTVLNAGQAQTVWGWFWPEGYLWQLRWPRVLTAMMAGFGLAVAGTVLQRLIRNPLASPDILGLSAGATLSIVVFILIFGAQWLIFSPLIAFGGSLAVLALLLFLGKKQSFTPGIMVLTGIALTALLDAILQFTLASGTEEVFSLLLWMSGSTYKVTDQQAIILTVGVLILSALTLVWHRALTLIAISDDVAQARGINLGKTRGWLLTLIAGICALITAVIGPVSFIGLLSPHLANLLGAKRILPQIVLASIAGASLLVLSDWVGRVALYPVQISAGVIASLIGGSYFIYLLTRQKL